MTPKEMALQFLHKFWSYERADTLTGAKQCALVCVDEILKAAPSAPIVSESGNYSNDIEESITYWQEVKQEREKL